jgi:molybdate transport system ATP-binding protein
MRAGNTMPPKAFLQLAGITIRMGDRKAFRNSCWTFNKDQNWALIGLNGSGKTLLACSLAGEVPVIEGEIRYRFRPPPGKSPEECVALVTFEQQRALAGEAPPAARWFSMEWDEAPSAGELLSYDSVEEVNPFEIRTRPPASIASFERLRRKVIKLLQIEPLIDCPVPSLSNGEMRKLLLARALLKRPRLLIIDDAFTGLDAHSRTHLKTALDRLMSSKRLRILLINPRYDEIPRGITHIIHVDGLQIRAQGPRQFMMRKPPVRRLLYADSNGNADRKQFRSIESKPTDSADELVKMEDVNIRYDGRTILAGINWIVRRGDSWALVGANGSGKTTLLSLISGDNPQAYANRIRLFGRSRGDGKSVWQIKRRIGWISSELHLHFPEDQRCIETVASGFFDSIGCFRTPSARQRKAAQKVLSDFGLGRFSQSSYGSLSTGLQRMVLLARALVKSPDLLLLDEPCQGLDFMHRTLFLRAIESLLLKTAVTLIYVTHVPDEIPRGIRRILRLRNGRAIHSSL